MAFAFQAQGKVLGFNPTQDGSAVFVKLSCEISSKDREQLKREDRERPLEIMVPQNLVSRLVPGAPVLVKGRFITFHREWENPQTRQKKLYEHTRYEAESVEAVAGGKAA